MALVQDVIEKIQDKIGALGGIKAAPDYVPEDPSVFPFVIAYEGPGTWNFGAVGEKQGLLSIKVELHIARKDMPRDVAQAVYYSDSIPNAIMDGVVDDLLGGTIDAIGFIESSGLVLLQYNAKGGVGEHIGYIFTLQSVKIRSNIT